MTNESEQCKDGCTILGLTCTVCGKTLRLLNIYVPKDKVPSEAFIEELSTFLSEGTRITLIPDQEVATLCEVGFDLDMHDKLYLSTQLVESLEDEF